MSSYEMCGLGAIGGLLPDLLRIIAARYGGAPAYLKSLFFWISLVLLSGLGAVTAYLLKADDVVKALAVGFSAPELLSRLLSDPKKDRGDQVASVVTKVRAWWAL